MKKRMLILVLFIFVGYGVDVVFSIFDTIKQRSLPGEIRIHFIPEQCKSIYVSAYEKDFHFYPLHRSPVVVTPIEQGEYFIKISLKDKKILWLRYYHVDAGERKRVDIYIHRLSTKEVRCKVIGYGIEVLGDKKVEINQSNENNPIDLYQAI